jgi:hypothetical protein
MPRSPSRLLIPAVALVALVFLSPSLATASPQDATLRSAAERSGLFTKLWDLLSAVWANGSILDPNGTGPSASSGPGTEPNAPTGDNGPGLDPDG